MATNNSKLKWDAALYQAEALKVRDSKELRAEYTRLRDIAQKRLSRLGKSEFSNTQSYQRYKDAFPKLKEIKNEGELRLRLSQLAKFVSSSTSSITGLKQKRKKQLASLHERGYDWVTEENFQEFYEWIDEYIDTHSTRHYYPAPEVVKEAFKEHIKEINPEEVKKEFNQRSKSSKKKERSKAKQKGSSEVKRMIKKERERQAAYQKPKTESKEIKKMIREQRRKRAGKK